MTGGDGIFGDSLMMMLLWQVLGEHDASVKGMLDTFGVYLKPSAFRKDVKPLLKEACSRIFGTATGLVDMMVQHFPSSKAGSAVKARLPAIPSMHPSIRVHVLVHTAWYITAK
jgi:hypothetical protein